MKLIRLSLGRFKGIRSLTIEPNGEPLSIFGDNATGKTTLADSFSWVLWGKDSSGSADFTLKSLTPDGEPIHGLDHEVEAELELPDGRRTVLLRRYHETWTKRRGEGDRTLTGHTTEFFIDGVPMSKAEYDSAIAAIAPEETFRLLTDPLQFPERLHWQKRRALLLEVCGEVTDPEVIASDRALADLAGILRDRKMEDHKRVVAARKAEINRELDRLPVRIDEVDRSLPELPEGSTEETLAVRLRSLREERRDAEAERQRITGGGEAGEKRKLLREVENELGAVKMRAAEAENENLITLSRAYGEAQSAAAEAKRIAAQVRRELAEHRSEVERLDARLKVLRERRAEIDAEVIAVVLPDQCAACGQALPPEAVEDARAKAEANFNEAKARRLAEIDEEGRRLRAQRDTLAAGLVGEAGDSRLAAAEIEAERLESEAAGVQIKMEEARTAAPEPSTDPEHQRLTSEAEALEREITALETDNSLALQAATERVGQLDAEIADAERTLARFEQRRQGEARIAQLKGEERTLGEEMERLEREIFLMEEFTRAKVRLLESRINSRFKVARFQLFRVLVNGGLEDCCEVTVGGVPYSSGLNNGARINAGLDIINALSEHWGFAPPVFIDGAESVTELLRTRGQQIRLAVSAADKVLRIERNEQS